MRAKQDHAGVSYLRSVSEILARIKKTTGQHISLRTYLLPLKEKTKQEILLFPFFLVTGELKRNILHPDEPKR